MPDVKIVCPICKKELELKDNPFRPFCSERCKLIDLGTWASEEYKIEGRPEDEGGGRTPKEEQ
ncbi:MAG TPA: DNA gyrase inhibitor YacG [Nitrospiraceae bacterium]|nr:DNA gyrase inhibitor YacG [Nitrospiraceae bacterium]